MSKITQRLDGFTRCRLSMDDGKLYVSFYDDDGLLFGASGAPRLVLGTHLLGTDTEVDFHAFRQLAWAAEAMDRARAEEKK